MSKMRVKQVSLKVANAFVMKYHRHHSKTQGHKFSIACVGSDGEIYGVAIVGRPLSRHLDDGDTLEVTRLAVVEGVPNGCSFLYGACTRIVRSLGYRALITYTLASESGVSLRASGWSLETTNAGGGEWKRNDGERTRVITDLFGETEKYPIEAKARWRKTFYLKGN